ncbi:MAG: DEAD/DEAH box helicase [Xanthomonadaceae bacterium]|nr:DEAD/DEAH box helicase [Xanthomonadaceae bacterium]
MKTFSELNLVEPLKKSIEALGFTIPTPIQALSVPATLLGKNMIGVAQTGSGKTAAFSIPMITALIKNPQLNGLVLVPTRELADQVCEVIRSLTKFVPLLNPVMLIGGVAMGPQFRDLKRNPRIIVATPGRLMDHMGRKSVRLINFGFVVLDEADRMLDMGFLPQIERIFLQLPRQRQTLLFSATMPVQILKLTHKYIENPLQVKIESTPEQAPKISQKTIEISQNNKNDILLDEINTRVGSILIFTGTQHRADRVARFLLSYAIKSDRIHGGRSQAQRKRALDEFRSETIRVLVATDIAARGIDVDHVAHVINYDLPRASEDYVHRIGRTGRAGREGQALSFISGEDKGKWKAIQRLMKQSGKHDFVEQVVAAPASSRAPRPAPVQGLERTMSPHRPSAPYRKAAADKKTSRPFDRREPYAGGRERRDQPRGGFYGDQKEQGDRPSQATGANKPVFPRRERAPGATRREFKRW